MAKRREKMATIVGDDHVGPSRARHLGNVCIVDSTACCTILHRRVKESLAIGGRQVVDRQAGEHFFLEQPRTVRRCEPELRWQPRRGRP